MSWLLAAVILGVGAALAGLLLPHIRFLADVGHDRSNLEVSSLWFKTRFDLRRRILSGRVLFFRIRRRIKVSPRRVEPEKVRPSRPPARDRRAEAPVKRDWSMARRLVWRERELVLILVRRLLTLLRKLVLDMKVVYLKARLDIATPDPMLTGVLFGAMQPLLMLNSPPGRVFSLDAAFDRDLPRFDLSCAVSTRPICVLVILAGWLPRLPWRRMVKVGWRLRHKRAG